MRSRVQRLCCFADARLQIRTRTYTICTTHHAHGQLISHKQYNRMIVIPLNQGWKMAPLNKQPWTLMLNWLQYTYSCLLFRHSILTRNVGHTDLVFGVRSGFISRPVHVRLQVSVCSSYNIVPPWLTSRHRCAYTHRQTAVWLAYFISSDDRARKQNAVQTTQHLVQYAPQSSLLVISTRYMVQWIVHYWTLDIALYST